MARVSTFTARYEGWCAHCPNMIEPGDEVCYLDDEIACEECTTQALADEQDAEL